MDDNQRKFYFSHLDSLNKHRKIYLSKVKEGQSLQSRLSQLRRASKIENEDPSKGKEETTRILIREFPKFDERLIADRVTNTFGGRYSETDRKAIIAYKKRNYENTDLHSRGMLSQERWEIKKGLDTVREAYFVALARDEMEARKAELRIEYDKKRRIIHPEYQERANANQRERLKDPEYARRVRQARIDIRNDPEVRAKQNEKIKFYRRKIRAELKAQSQ